MARPLISRSFHDPSTFLRALPALLRGRRTAAAVAAAAGLAHLLRATAKGLHQQSVWLRSWWTDGPKERRGPALICTAVCLLGVFLVPYGPALALLALLATAAWTGRAHSPGTAGPGEAAVARLRCVYEALIPAFSSPDHPASGFTHGGDWADAFDDFAFDGADRVTMLRLSYPWWFADQDPACRARVEHVLRAKAGRDREYRFVWYEEDNHLLMTAPPPLPTDIAAQRFVTAPGETVLGFTDPESSGRTSPVTDLSGRTRQTPPVLWHTGPRSTDGHLLALGRPGSGTTTLLRSLALQALPHGDVVIVDGAGCGEFMCLTGRPGVLAVESGLAGALAALEWVACDTERRLIAVNRARRAGHALPEDVRRPLWILFDRPTSLAQLATAEGAVDPQTLLDFPLRHGRAANVVVAAADVVGSADDLLPAFTAHCRTRVALGPLTDRQAHDILGAPPATTTVPEPPPGRGHARVGGGPVVRLQVPYAPDPYDEHADTAARASVAALLTPRHVTAAGVPVTAKGITLPPPKPGRAPDARPGAPRPV